MGESTAETSQRKPHCHQLIVLAVCSSTERIRCPAVCDDPLLKHEGMAAMENAVSMSIGDLLQDCSSDSISSHQKQAKKSSCAKIAAAASSGADCPFITLNYIIFFFLLGM